MVTPLSIELTFFPDTGARRPAVLVGQTIRSHAGFRTEAGALVQPGGLTVTVKRPDGVLVTMPPEQIGLDADGRYRVDLTADVPGTWGVQWRCATPGEAVREREFAAQPQQVVPGDPGPVLVMDDLGPPVTPSGGPFTARRVSYLPVFEHADGLILIAVENGELKALPFGSLPSANTAFPVLRVGTNMGDGTGLQLGGTGPGESAGAWFKKDGHANWTVLQTGQPYGGTEFNIYGNPAQGDCDLPAGTNRVLIKTANLLPQTAWIGDPLLIGVIGGFKITAINTATPPAGYVAEVTVSQWTDAPVAWGAAQTNWTWTYLITRAQGFCDISGTTVTWKSGDKFIPFRGSYLRFAGQKYSVVAGTPTSLTLDAAPGNAVGVAFDQKQDIDQQVSGWHVQLRSGEKEETLGAFARAGWGYDFFSYSDNAKGAITYPIRFAVGYDGTTVQYLFGLFPGTDVQAVSHQDGFVTLGHGIPGQESVRVLRTPGSVAWVEFAGGPAGALPSLAARGAAADVTVGYDAKGLGGHRFTNGSYARTLLDIFGTATATGFLDVLADNGQVQLIATAMPGKAADVVLGASNGVARLNYTPAAGSNSQELAPTSWVRNTARLRTEATYTFFAELAPTLNQVVAAFPVASSGRIPAGLVGSSMLAETPITGAAAVQLWDGASWTTIGTFTFSGGVQPSLSGAPVADLPVTEGTHRLRVIATSPWTKASLEVRLKQL
jgi:hypothetical protein